MDICMFSPFSLGAPSTYRLLSFAKVLIKKGNSVTIVLPSLDKYSGFQFASDTSFDRIHLFKPFQLKRNKPLTNMVPYAFSSILYSFRMKFDVVHILKTMPASCFGYAAKLSRRVPTVQDIDDLDHLVMIEGNYSRLSTWVVAQSEKVFPKLADHVVVSSSSLKKIYSQMGLESDKITQISNGVCIADFDLDPDVGLKEKCNLKGEVIVYVGLLNSETQLRPLILSMRKVISERKDVSCLIVGDGTARQSLQRLVQKLNLEEHFVFVGKVSHSMVPSFLSVSDIGFACFRELESLNYSSNIKIFEYMASGLPVVVNPVGDLPFYVDYGRAGVVTSPSIDELSNVLTALLSDERRRKNLADHAKKYVKNFDWEVLTEKLIDIYRGLD